MDVQTIEKIRGIINESSGLKSYDIKLQFDDGSTVIFSDNKIEEKVAGFIKK